MTDYVLLDSVSQGEPTWGVVPVMATQWMMQREVLGTGQKQPLGDINTRVDSCVRAPSVFPAMDH